MAAGQAQAYVKAIEELLEQKNEILAKEKEAIENLSGILNKMGYRIVPMNQAPAKRRGRPPGSGKKSVTTSAPKKRRGRPPKAKSEAS
jgi:hypothetical protein